MEPLSRTEKKKAALSKQSLGEQLVELSIEQLKTIGLQEDIFDAVKMAKTITKHGALQRQMQYIGTLMRKHDTAPIQAFLDTIEQGKHKRSEDFKKIEAWRDGLIAGNDQLVEEIVQQLHGIDQQHLIGLMKQAREELARKNPSPKAARALFRYLNTASQQP